jgi:hypothetical protein
MKYTFLSFLLLLVCGISFADFRVTMSSPDGRLSLLCEQKTDGSLYYSLNLTNKSIIKPSSLGMRLSKPELTLNRFQLISMDSVRIDESWTPVWGEESSIRNNCRELTLKLKDASGSGVCLNIIFRIFNDGIGFRYEFPEQKDLNHFIVAEEKTQFALAGDHKTFWIPGDYDTNEYGYHTCSLSEIPKTKQGISQEIFAQSRISGNAVQTPLMMKAADGYYVNIHEAALVNYPAMQLELDPATFTLTSLLVPDALGNKAYLQAPAKTPWRTIVVCERAADVLMSRIILNLNEPCKIANTSWIKPQKFCGVWWEMHVGIASWDYASSLNGSGKRHGANTENVKRYIDFAARHGISSVLVEGWDTGWEDWFGQWKEDVFDFVTPYPDFDVQQLSEYAKSKGVKIIMHHETSASVTNYERWMDTAYRFMKKYNYDAVKTGYVGTIIPRGEHHDGQWMVKHYERVAKKTADYKIMVDMHEPVRSTGLCRTWPNWLASEAARGNEFNAWSEGSPPDHETILPFTRLMGGPMDYTPGIFKIKLNVYDPNKKEQVHTTLTKQLALYVTMYSPLQMAADLPENYEARPDAFKFIEDVAVDWDKTKVIDAEPGDYIITARKAKGKDAWFVGAITDENSRKLPLSLDFLDPSVKYEATIYRDADNADWKENPEAYVIEKKMVTNRSKIDLKLAPGGGTAISLIPLK